MSGQRPGKGTEKQEDNRQRARGSREETPERAAAWCPSLLGHLLCSLRLDARMSDCFFQVPLMKVAEAGFWASKQNQLPWSMFTGKAGRAQPKAPGPQGIFLHLRRSHLPSRTEMPHFCPRQASGVLGSKVPAPEEREGGRAGIPIISSVAAAGQSLAR